jgi:predicted ABC-type ATPase
VNRPSFTLIAGANGSGKSTLTTSNPGIFASFPILDPDAIARTIQSTVTASSAITAGRQSLQIAKQLLHDQKSFVVETTLSGKNYLQMMLDAHSLGFEVVLVYIGTEMVEVNLARIANRVLVGGHDVPETDVRRRYQRSLENAPIAISRADHVKFSSTTPPSRVINWWA